MYKFRYTRENGQTYTHSLPAPVECTIEEEKVAKEGSGRSSNDGTMTLEYLGIASVVNIKWGLMPGTKEYINLYKILEALPDFFTFIYPSPNGDNEFELECYNSKWSIQTFRIRSEKVYFTGLTTKFISRDLRPLNDDEPILF